MNIVAQYGIRGDGARGIVTSVETAIRQGRLAAGTPLPTVRDLARALRVSPTTVAAAYRTLRVRGLVHAQGRRGTRVSPRPPLPIRPVAPAPAHLRDLSLGNPDPALLPSLTRALARLPRRPGLYGEPANRPALLALAGRQLERECLPHDSLDEGDVHTLHRARREVVEAEDGNVVARLGQQAGQVDAPRAARL